MLNNIDELGGVLWFLYLIILIIFYMQIAFSIFSLLCLTLLSITQVKYNFSSIYSLCATLMMTLYFSPFINNVNPDQERPRPTRYYRKICRFSAILPNLLTTKTWPLLLQNILREKATYSNTNVISELSLPYNCQIINPVLWQKAQRARKPSVRNN